ncbi:hypothetical protein RJ640_017854, partial [Escallonia rubra]
MPQLNRTGFTERKSGIGRQEEVGFVGVRREKVGTSKKGSGMGSLEIGEEGGLVKLEDIHGGNFIWEGMNDKRAQHMYSLPAYAFIAQDFTTQAALYTHHQYIAGFIMTGAFAHGAIFFIRDYNPEQNEDNVLARMLDHKEAIISHLSWASLFLGWASLFLGFHTLGLYVHNDVMLAFGTPEKQILIEPIFAQWIQSAHGKTSYGFDVLLSSTNGPAFNAGRSIWLPGWLNAVNENTNLIISQAQVNEGTTVKKLKPRARGRSYAIKRTTCHITIVVKDISLDEYVDMDFLE